jgi:hypothetical protein
MPFFIVPRGKFSTFHQSIFFSSTLAEMVGTVLANNRSGRKLMPDQ